MDRVKQEIKKKIEADLKKFLQDKTLFKEFSQCMNESNKWLEQIRK